MEHDMEVVKRRLTGMLHHLASEGSFDDLKQGSVNNGELVPAECAAEKGNQKVVNELPDSGSRGHHQGKEPFKWNGWGYDDSEFKLNQQGHIFLSGTRYSLSGVAFPKLRPWAEQHFGLDVQHHSPPNPQMPKLPRASKHEQFLKEIEGHHLKISFEDKDRFFHAHGHTAEEVFNMRYGSFERYPDVVIWPGKHEHVEAIVKAATTHNVVIIPYGGGTSVSYALLCPKEEQRMIVSLDMHEMNRIKWIDYQSLMACIETGIVGKDLDAKLAKLGLCMGHEPDSSEFSTLGGWIATRASGMKKNVYGNIEDILVTAKMVTPLGTVEKGCNVPRISAGPDINQMILGSEGTLGVVTEAVVKLRPLPEVRKYGSIVFPDFESGVACLREITKQKCAPASIRLVDNMQFQFGQVLKPEGHSQWEEWIDAAKKWYVTQYKGFEVEKMVAATLLFEGSAQDVPIQEKKVYSIATKFGGLAGGEENGKRGYFLTYMIAYIRDFGFNYYLIAESFETSCPWANVLNLCTKVKERIVQACKEHGIKFTPFVSCRVTQTYDVGACIYFYFAFIYRGLKDPLHTYMDIEHEAREEVLKNGGSISHHHGIGKLRKRWMKQTQSPVGMEMLKGLKKTVDPNNIFGSQNLVDNE